MTTVPTRDAWIIRYKPNPTARLRLFCFPYAGGNASIFRTWADDLPADVEVCAVQLPGRATRLLEPPFTRLAPLLDALQSALLPYLNLPFAFFGHSMGALVCFELARQLRRQHSLSPVHLFVAGRRAAQLPDTDAPIYYLPDSEFIAELQQLNGMPDSVVQDPELMSLVLPALRADVELCETYQYVDEAPLDCSTTAFGGLQDYSVPHDHIAAWQEQTYSTFKLRMFPGDHFFLHSARDLLLDAISRDLNQLLHWIEIGR